MDNQQDIVISVRDVRTWILGEEFDLDTLCEALSLGFTMEEATELALVQK